MIVSNPPYIETDVISSLQRDVRDFEPHLALDGGPDGLKYYRKLTMQSLECLKAGGIIIYEIGYNQAGAVCAILEQYDFKDIEVLQDLSGYDRCVKAKKYP
jgi:release factor glutamine methyltransferase